MKPMLARTVGPKFDMYPCYGQRKFNGVRAMFEQIDMPDAIGVFQSRDEKVWQPLVLKHLREELATLSLKGIILDGELYKHGWRLQRINGAVAVNRSQPREDTHEVEYHIFDVVNPNKLFSERFFEVYHYINEANLPHIRAVQTQFIPSKSMMQPHFELYTREGYEGIMLRPEGFYDFGEHMGRNGTPTAYRSKSLWKHKAWEDDEFEVIGAIDGLGKAAIGVGALMCRTKKGVPFDVGTGLTDRDRIDFSQKLPKIVKVRYLCLTEAGKPFNPSFMCVML